MVQAIHTEHIVPGVAVIQTEPVTPIVPIIQSLPDVQALPTLHALSTIEALPPVVITEATPASQALPTLPTMPTVEAIPVLTHTEVRDDLNQFALSFSTGNGIAVAQQGALKQLRSENGQLENVLVQRGSYSYYGTDGRLYKVNYIADENGN